MKKWYAIAASAVLVVGIIYMFSTQNQGAVAAADKKPVAAATAKDAAKPARSGNWFTNNDTNKDGKLTNAEFHAAHEKHFQNLDTNKDGAVSAEEMKAFRDKQRAERKQGQRKNKQKRKGS